MVRVYVSFVASLAAIGVGSRAEAQLASSDESVPKPVVVNLRASEPLGVRLELYDPKKRPPRDLPAAVCFDRCRLTALPGRYLLRVSGPPGSDVRTSKRALDLTTSAEVVVHAPSVFGRYTGLVVGITGVLALSLGGALLVGDVERYRTSAALLLGAGVVATPAGWVLFGLNGTPRIEINAVKR